MKRFTLFVVSLLVLGLLSVPAGAVSVSDGQPPDIQSETAVLINADTGQVLYQKDMDKRMYPASITKIMTGLLGLRYGNMTDNITVSENAVETVDPESANIALSPDEVLTMEQALYAISIASANDAANGIAETVGGSIDGFVSMMNEAAKEAGATNTHFNNANGLPDTDHYTTAHDMALITAQALQTPGFTEIFGAKRYKIPPTNKQPETRIVNSSNRFLNGDMIYDGMLISKAGWTNDAQHTLVTAASRNGTTLIAVVMKSTDSLVKWSDTVSLFDYGFEQFERVTISKDAILDAAPADLRLSEADIMIDPDTYDISDIALLMPKDKSADNILISFGVPQLDEGAGEVEIPVNISVPSDDPADEPEVSLTTMVKASLRDANSETGADESGASTAKMGVFKIVLIIFAAIIGVFLLLFGILVIRRAVIVRRRRRKRREAGRRATR